MTVWNEDLLHQPKDYFYKLIKDENLPEVKYKLKFDSVIILPTEDMHNSGFRIMNFILLDKNLNPIAKATGGADVFRLNINPSAWHIDCLPCGLLRFFHVYKSSVVLFNGNEFEIYSADRKHTPTIFDRYK